MNTDFCKSCGNKVEVHPKTQKKFDYCSLSCQYDHQQSKKIAPKCKNGCGRDCFFEDGKYYDFCGRTCKESFQNNHKKTAPKCKNGCGRDCYFENGKYYDFCGKSCLNEHKKKTPTNVSDFMGFFTTNKKCRCGCGKDCNGNNVFASSSCISKYDDSLKRMLSKQLVFPFDIIIILSEQSENIKIDIPLHIIYLTSIQDISPEIHSRTLCVIYANDVSKFKDVIEKQRVPFYSINEKDLNQKVKNLFKKSTKLIHFYEKDDPFYEFTNFYESKFKDENNLEWKTSEHYFQAHKFDEKRREEVRNLPTPRDCFSYAKNNSKLIRNDWHDPISPFKIKVMRKALFLKFKQNDYLKNLLLSTGDADLVEHTKNDSYWGDNYDGTGENMLGKLLKELRENLFKQ